jgi:hypothetical protein
MSRRIEVSMRLLGLIAGVLASASMLPACPSGSSGDSSAEPAEGSAGHEATGEMDGFDTEGFEESQPTIDHGRGSARELLGVNPPPQPWASMSHADQEMYMVGYVLPIHAEIFHEHDAERYAQFECATCHGDDGAERNYEMPSRYLPALPRQGTRAWTQMQERNPEAYRFMAEQVTPTMRTQLGLPEFNPRTGRGFGCFGCHPQAGG